MRVLLVCLLVLASVQGVRHKLSTLLAEEPAAEAATSSGSASGSSSGSGSGEKSSEPKWHKVLTFGTDQNSKLAFSGEGWKKKAKFQEAGDQIYSEYFTKPFRKLKLCVGKKCYEHTLNTAVKSARDLFTGGEKKEEIDQTKFDIVMQRDVKSTGGDCGPVKSGFNLRCSGKNYVRFGYCAHPTVEGKGCISKYGSVRQRIENDGAYLGCFKDAASRDLEKFHGSGYTRKTCAQKARGQRHNYFGLQAGGQCYTGNKYGRHKKLDESKCATKCKNDPKVICGGTWANSVYLANNDYAQGVIGVGLRTDKSLVGSGWTKEFISKTRTQQTRRVASDVYVLEQAVCAVNNGNCDKKTSCEDEREGVTCGKCPEGYTGTGEKPCKDVDECQDGNNGGCDKLTKCTNKPGTFECSSCPKGYKGTGLTGCIDINECKVNNGNCDAMTLCKNKPGGHDCSKCPEGFEGSGKTKCTDLNECSKSYTGKTCDKLTKCSNTVGSFNCGACPSGYTGDGARGCEDINECAHHKGLCDILVSCTNSEGSYQCGKCPKGYTGNGKDGCEDINECNRENGGCDALAKCINERGTRSCGPCPHGYLGTGASQCIDIDECKADNGGCDIKANCYNTPGSRECGNCPPGYTGDGYTKCEKETALEEENRGAVPNESPMQMANRIAIEEAKKFANKRQEAYEKKSAEDALAQEERDKAEELERLRKEAATIATITNEEMAKRQKEILAHEEMLKKRKTEEDKAHADVYIAKAKQAALGIFTKVTDDMAAKDSAKAEEDAKKGGVSLDAKAQEAGAKALASITGAGEDSKKETGAGDNDEVKNAEAEKETEKEKEKKE